MEKIKYHLAEDTIDANDIEKLIEWLRINPRLTKGPLTPVFEKRWSEWLGRKYSVFVNSGSSANLLMYYALLLSGRLRNKKVVVPSVGWLTTVSPAIQFGFEPIMCEADPDTFGLDLVHLEKILKEHNPAAVMMVQVLGVPHKMEELTRLKEKYNFFLLEDACAAMGSTYRGKNVGTFGDMSTFALYFGHQLSTIEGGLISTDDKDFYDLLLMLRSHGWGKDLDKEKHDELLKKYKIDDFHSPFVFYIPGFNLRSTDLGAFLGINQMDKMEWLRQKRHKNHVLYEKYFGDKFYYQKYDPNSLVCSISFGMLAKDTEERQKIVKALEENGIETRIFSAGNLGLHPFWYERYGKFKAPIADKIHYSGFFLPNNPSLKKEDIEFIVKVVLDASDKTGTGYFNSEEILYSTPKNLLNGPEKKSKVLVTGAAGYIGSVLTAELLKSGYEVVALDNFMYSQTSLLDCANNVNLKIVRGDARNEKLMAELIKDVQYIIPLACIVGAPACDKNPEEAKEINLDAIKLILKLRGPHQKIIYPNTNSGYGIGQNDIYCDENTPLNPISLYGRLKVEAEKAILESRNAVVFRLATVFGISPRMRLDLLVNDFVFRAINDGFVIIFEGHFKRNYVYIRDVAKAFIFAMENFEKLKNEAYNLGLSDANLSKIELCEEIRKQVPKFTFLESKIGEDVDKRNYIVSNAKIEKAGFKAQVSVEEGIKELIKGYEIVRLNNFSNL